MRISLPLRRWLMGMYDASADSLKPERTGRSRWLHDRLNLTLQPSKALLLPQARVDYARSAAEFARGVPAPVVVPELFQHARLQHGLKWLESVWATPVEPVTLVDMKSLNATRVFRVTDDHRNDWIFRRLPGKHSASTIDFLSEEASEIRNGRLTLAAADLNEALGLTTVPRARLVRVRTPQGSVLDGVRSEIAPGVPDARLRTNPHALLRELLPSQAADIAAFEYLVGNLDVHAGLNMHVDKRGRAQVFDHGLAFWGDLNAVSKTSPIGTTLPESGYTSTFLNALDSLVPDHLRKKFGDVLCKEEIDALIFRRAMILADARR